MIIEMRTYKTKPGKRTEFLEVFRSRSVPAHNHVHLIAVPGREDSLSILFRRVHGRYAQYYNARASGKKVS
jgi:hypothetical protein